MLNHSCGDDLTVVNAAKVSFNKRSDVMGKKEEGLINYLASHKHVSPFGHCFASFTIEAPVFVRAQMVKHKFLRVNEVSRRYVDSPPEFYTPDEWRGRPIDKKQGSDGIVSVLRYLGFKAQTVKDGQEKLNTHALDLYKDMVEANVAPEMARMVLPQSMMTSWWWSGSLDAFAAMCVLRCAPDAQYESRVVADQIFNIMSSLYPKSWEALMNVDS